MGFISALVVMNILLFKGKNIFISCLATSIPLMSPNFHIKSNIIIVMTVKMLGNISLLAKNGD